jgi:SAM-dependent methyltransferase
MASSQSIVMSDQVVSCPLCGSTDRTRFYQGEHLGFLLVYLLCKTCGLVYQSPRMTEDQLRDFYVGQYRELYHGRAEPTPRDLYIQEQRAAHLAGIVCKGIDFRPAYHLDIGCGSGALVQTMQEICGCRSEGIEPDAAYRPHAAGQGLIVYASLDEWLAESDAYPDLVTMSHVLEHLMDPVEYLSGLRQRAIKPRGYLLVEVPNLFVHKSFELAHNFAFSPGVLREVIRKAGFGLLLFKRHGVPIMKSPLYLTILAQSLDDPLPPYDLRPHARGAKLFRVLGRSLYQTEAAMTRTLQKVCRRLRGPGKMEGSN